ncbi:hypothetical protein GQ43DRAFT_475020 [Delitschia confertaspora ATCC 74209]|uniref:Malate dehydrogenase n=1 Tax=Delitschia confertaspora ATCC 74209 TaxID=1513339 RepID=A0A9P4JGM5_9PLEO|nr:hypothetical protein GQ43DRAFT_475020 [Delitschia confertaspora ATCC 74209]
MRSTLVFIFAGLPLSLLAIARPQRGILLPGQVFGRDVEGPCDVSGITLPENAQSLPPPTEGLQLILIAQGTGTQNYTCADATAKPAALGALATLVNATCEVAQNALGTVNEDSAAIGVHYFVDASTPDFDIIGLGNTELKKVATVSAPSSDDVPFLKLMAQEQGTTGPIREIYRVATRGGVPPADCSEQKPNSIVTVNYTAQYWFYSCVEESV